MTVRRLIIWFVACLSLALISRWQVYSWNEDHCSLDGSAIVPVYRVDLVVDGEVREQFCCIRCALEWPEATPGATWRVRDEVTGEVLDASVACFVRSSVMTVTSRGGRTHSFKKWPDAMEHVAVHGGERIPNPFVPAETYPALEDRDP